MWLKDFDDLNSYYLKYALTNYVEQLKLISKGTAYSALTIMALKKYNIPFPIKSKQLNIVKVLDSLNNELEKVIIGYRQKLTNLEDFKKSLLEQAFAGELTSKDMPA